MAPSYPELPADLRVCFDKTIRAPKPGTMTKREVIILIASLKQSEAMKTECGKRLIAFYDSLAGEPHEDDIQVVHRETRR